MNQEGYKTKDFGDRTEVSGDKQIYLLLRGIMLRQQSFQYVWNLELLGEYDKVLNVAQCEQRATPKFWLQIWLHLLEMSRT